MSSIEILESKISFLLARLATAKKYRSFTLKQVESQQMVRGAVERELYLICQSAIDLAEAFIAFRKFRKPNTMRESFDILREEGILPRPFAEEFAKITGFRNAMAHGYENLDSRVVYDVLQNKLAEVQTFIKHVKKALAK